MQICIDRLQGHSIVASALKSGSLVIDLGANSGRFAQLITERYGVRCVCFEPNPERFALIPYSERIVKHQFAAGAKVATVELYVDENPEASSTIFDVSRARGIKVAVRSLPLDKILHLAGGERIELMKVDIEGSETEFFENALDQDLKRINQLSLEFHEMHGWTRRADITLLLDRMRRLGFEVVRMSALHYGDVLFLNRCHFGTTQVSEMTSAAKRYRNRRVFNALLEKGIQYVAKRKRTGAS